MPGRLITSPDSYVLDPAQQFMSAAGRPVPAVRRNARPLPDSRGVRGVSVVTWTGAGHSSQQARDGKTPCASSTDMAATRRLGEGQNHQPRSSPTSFQLPGQPVKATALFRPQSAMAFSSPPPSYSQAKPMYPARPPSSLGVSWGPSACTPGVSGDTRYNQGDVMVRTHHRGHSHGDGLLLDEGSSGFHYTSQRSEDVYTSVARRQGLLTHGESAVGYDAHSHVQPQTRLSDRLPGMPGHPPADGGVSDNLGQDNPAFMADDQSHGPGETNARRPSTSLDMRSAWQRLYGNSPDTGVSGRRPSVDDVMSSGRARSLDGTLAAPSSRQQSGHLASPQPSQTHLQHPRLASSYLHEPAHNTAGSSIQNGRSTPQTTVSSSHNGRSTPQPAVNSFHNGRSTPQAAVNSFQNERFTPHNPANSDWHAGSSSLDHPGTTVRESPTGQSSSNPDPTSGSANSSQLSAYSATTRTLSSLITHKKRPDCSAGPMIGPSSKYPETQMGMRMSTQATRQTGVHQGNRTQSEDRRAESRQSLSSPNFTSKPTSPRRQSSSTSDAAGFHVKEDGTRPPSRFSSAFLDSDDSFEDENSLHPLDSVFNYNEVGSEDGRVPSRASSQFTHPTSSQFTHPTSSQFTHPTSSQFTHPTSSQVPRVTSRALEQAMPGSVTPALSHRTSSDVTSPDFPPKTPDFPPKVPDFPPKTPDFLPKTPDFLPKTPDLLRKSPEARVHQQISNSNSGKTSTQQTDNRQKTHLNRPSNEVLRSKDGQQYNPARSRSLDDLRESEDDSLLSFDVENTLLTVEPSDQSDRGTVPAHKGSNSVRAQLNRLEGMYSHVLKTLGDTSHGTRARRRWSIGSSDTSSMRHQSHHSWRSKDRLASTSAHRLASKDVKAIGKRFQRLESHVITLARSVAHLSSELRVQNSLSREMENVKREIQELKTQSSASPVLSGNQVRSRRLMTDFERSQGWVPSLTDPRRVNKLTKFFGQEPPLLEIFLKQLGYEKFLKNFQQEHVGMIELPYMTEDKLQGLGIPMGPRLRILQEAQVYFQQANVDLYFV